MSPLAEKILAWLREETTRQGTGRRMSKIALHLGIQREDEMYRAISELNKANLTWFDYNEIMGWYVILREAEARAE